MHRPARKPRVLIVIAHFDDSRNPNGRPNFVPQGVGHAFLAGAFASSEVELMLYSEFYSGPLADEKMFSWPDMLVLTGVTSAFDRMRQLAAYTRVKSPKCVVVAGGPAVRNLPRTSASTFDYACNGDVEELATVAQEVFGPHVVADHFRPRFDLLTWNGPVNYAESSRYCNFRCSFCALTAENRPYAAYDLDFVEEQLRSYRRPKPVLFVDNNFYGNNRSLFYQKLDLLEDLVKRRILPGWLALVTSDFFSDPMNLTRAREAGCLGLFCGVESFNADQIKAYNKRQNLVLPQLEVIRACLEAGIVFQYGLLFDPTVQLLEDMEAELDFVLNCDRIPLPAFLSLTIPLLGTPLFHDRLRSKQFLPMAKLRDMDGYTLLTRPIDELERVVPFVRSLAKLNGHSRQIARHSFGFWRRYRRSLSVRQMTCLIANSARLCMPSLINNRRSPSLTHDETLTYITSSQPLGPLYQPLFALPEHLRQNFSPTMITDEAGEVHPDIAGNLTRLSTPVREQG
ncbi:Fe-S oxidoreductase [Microvirga lotononidis]|uniref:Fe-S oxidoreductase n=1 Tax=Microvirga lotononidis TaxID=864069 RepID=I4Z3N9_9HYPH|nr:Fe-S oxidoreductase [Microvirga lotononidis]